VTEPGEPPHSHGLGTPETTGTIEIVRQFKAPPSAVFRAWTDPAVLMRWLAQKADSDPRMGGHYRLETDEPGDVLEPHVCSGEYREFVPDQRLVMTWIYNGPHPEDLAESLISIDFAAIDGDATEIHFREVGEGLATDEERDYSRAAWQEAFNNLDRAIIESHTV
jgi:uncharacterized protein YndB with AHSA1/START domain